MVLCICWDLWPNGTSNMESAVLRSEGLPRTRSLLYWETVILSGSRFRAGNPERRTHESRCSDAVYAMPGSINWTQDMGWCWGCRQRRKDWIEPRRYRKWSMEGLLLYRGRSFPSRLQRPPFEMGQGEPRMTGQRALLWVGQQEAWDKDVASSKLQVCCVVLVVSTLGLSLSFSALGI